eukprot:14750_1
MSRRYDSRTTQFSPEGRLYQVEYAMEAISQAGAAVGILTDEGILLGAEKRIKSKLLDVRSATEKMYPVDKHVTACVAGIQSDARILLDYAQRTAQQYLYRYGEPIPIEQLLQKVCNLKQGYTQFGGYRPFGVSFLFAGWDREFGFQLYESDPSGNYTGWKAYAIGANNQAAQSILKSDYKKGKTTLEEAKFLAVKVLSKTMDTVSPSSDKMEFSMLTEKDGEVSWHIFTKKEVDALLEEAKEKVDFATD